MTEKLDLNKLVADAAGGNDAAFAQLYELSVKTAYHTASLLLKSHEDIEDVVQNAYLRASCNLGELKNPESFVGWIKIIVENESKNYIKKESRKSLPVVFINEKRTEFEVDTKPVPDELMERDDLCKSVNQIIDSLSPESRACVVLFHYEDKSLNDIAEILDIPLGTVKSRLFKARKYIEKEFSKLRKKDPTLYGVGAIPFILSLWAVQAESATVPASLASFSAVTAAQTATAAASAGAGAAAGTASTAATATATTAAATAGTGSVAAGATASIGIKIAAVAVAGSVAAGGTAAVVNHVKENEETTAYSVSSTVLPEETCTVTEFPSQEALLQLTTEEASISEASSEISQTSATTKETAKASAAASSAAAKTTSPKTTAKATTAKARTTAATTAKASTTAKQTTTRHAATAAPTTNPANNYSASGGVITSYSGTSSNVSVPSTINSAPVTSIGAGAFAYNTNITSVSLPSTVTQIGQEAFADCTSLRSVSMPSSLKVIGIAAFYNCTSLRSVSVPSGATTISDEAFANCSNLASITIPSSVTTIASDAFDGCDSLTIICAEGSAAHTFAQENSINFTLQ